MSWCEASISDALSSKDKQTYITLLCPFITDDAAVGAAEAPTNATAADIATGHITGQCTTGSTKLGHLIGALGHLAAQMMGSHDHLLGSLF